MITVIHKSDILKSLPSRYAKQYENYRGVLWDGTDPREKAKKLTALVWPFTVEQVGEILGSTSWTKMECDECGFDFDTLVRIGEEPDYEARWQDFCKSCLHKALEAL